MASETGRISPYSHTDVSSVGGSGGGGGASPFDTLGGLTVARVRPGLYALRVKCMLNVYRFMFVTIAAGTDPPLTEGDEEAVCLVADLLPFAKSVQFVEFPTVDGYLAGVAAVCDYTTLVEMLEPLRHVGMKRVATTVDTSTGKGQKVSEYTSDMGTVMLFHTTDSDHEYVEHGNLLAGIITFNTLVYPDKYRSVYTLPVYVVDTFEGPEDFSPPPAEALGRTQI